MRLGLVVGGILLVGCGDPRVPFVGRYIGTAIFTYTNTGDERPGEADFTITLVDKSDRIAFGTACKFTAEVLDEETIQIDPVSCPPRSGMTSSGVKAIYTDTHDTGVGKLSGKTLSITHPGKQIASDFADGRPSVALPFSVEVTATRQ